MDGWTAGWMDAVLNSAALVDENILNLCCFVFFQRAVSEKVFERSPAAFTDPGAGAERHPSSRFLP